MRRAPVRAPAVTRPIRVVENAAYVGLMYNNVDSKFPEMDAATMNDADAAMSWYLRERSGERENAASGGDGITHHRVGSGSGGVGSGGDGTVLNDDIVVGDDDGDADDGKASKAAAVLAVPLPSSKQFASTAYNVRRMLKDAVRRSAAAGIDIGVERRNSKGGDDAQSRSAPSPSPPLSSPSSQHETTSLLTSSSTASLAAAARRSQRVSLDSVPLLSPAAIAAAAADRRAVARAKRKASSGRSYERLLTYLLCCTLFFCCYLFFFFLFNHVCASHLPHFIHVTCQIAFVSLEISVVVGFGCR